ncbi:MULTISPECIES: hypothetical protein [Sphingomonadales]|uniref:hypothetical protein n=1 Tax=Sphingomonadales TaxID=204457 RepID=UPI0008257E9F|nr:MULTISPECIES: hypothetical protein [Sphingomonadales]
MPSSDADLHRADASVSRLRAHAHQSQRGKLCQPLTKYRFGTLLRVVTEQIESPGDLRDEVTSVNEV